MLIKTSYEEKIIKSGDYFLYYSGIGVFCLWPQGVGINAPLTGDIPKVGEGTKFAAQMWLEDVTAAGGIEVGGKKYKVELTIEDSIKP